MQKTFVKTPAEYPSLVLCALAAALCVACGSTAGQVQGEATPYVPLATPDPDSIGFFLTDFDASVRAWTNLKLAGRGERDQRMLRGLEKEMGQRARKRQEELLGELQAGPPTNRSVAAVALGFTGDPTVMGSLYGALQDRDSDVVHNALLGLGHLAQPDTPPTEICYLLRNDPDPWVRNNAAYALQSVVGAGAPPTELVLRSCREALVDEEPGVRAQCASTLGLSVDAESIDDLGDLLYDDADLVAAASASALSHIGRSDMESKGKAARLLTDALGRVEDGRRSIFLSELRSMSEIDFGDEDAAWHEWARRLP